LGRNSGGDIASGAGVDFDRAVFHHAAHNAKAGQDGGGPERESGTDPDASADFAGRYAAENFDDGDRCVAHRVSGAGASAEDGSGVHRSRGPVSGANRAIGPHFDRDDGGGGRRGGAVQAEFLAADAEGVGAGAGT